MNDELFHAHFTAREFRCACGCGLGLEAMQGALLRRLVAARSVSAAAFVINSSIRCPEHNAAVGGVEDSAHLSGYAVDLAASDSRSRYHILIAARQAGFSRIGVGASFVHLDVDPDKPDRVVWTY